MKKRIKSQSSIIASVLIILLVLAAIIIVWAVVKKFVINETDNLGIGVFTTSLSIDNKKSILAENAIITIKRDTGKGEVIGIKFKVYNEAGEDDIITNYTIINELETRTFDLSSQSSISNINYVEAYPIFRTNSGKEKLGIMIGSIGEGQGGGGSQPSGGCTSDTQCNDGNGCTDDTCNIGTSECIFTNNANSCDDGYYCTINDVCSIGVCSGGSRDCSDGNECTTDLCSGESCQNVNVPDGTACSGGICQGGTCQVQGIPIYDSDCGLIISAPEEYYLAEDLSCSSGTEGIKITSDDVSINGNGKKIKVSSTPTKGIYILGISSDRLIGINLIGIIFEVGDRKSGVYIRYSDDFNISGSTFNFLGVGGTLDNTMGVFVQNSDSGIIENSVFSALTGEHTGIRLDSDIDNAKVISNNMDNLYRGIDAEGATGTMIKDNIITNSRFRGIDVGSNDLIDNEVCSVTGIGDFYDWNCNAYYSGNTCNYQQSHYGCGVLDPCNPPSCTL